MNNDIETLVFSSGGIKLTAFVGCMKALSKKILLGKVSTYVGVSAGSIISYFINLGYTWQELYKISMELNFSEFNQFDIEIFFDKYGLNDGTKIINFMKKMTIDKNFNENITFLELYNKTHKKLIISATCITDSKLEYFDYINSPNMKVLKAIRLSLSIPYYFTTERYNGKLYIDGAVLEHLPLSLFRPSDKILGLSLVNHCRINRIDSLEKFTYSIFYCMRKNMNKFNKDEFNIIEIDTRKHSLLNFDITKDEKKDLFLSGYNDTITQLTCIESKKEYDNQNLNKKKEEKIKRIEEQIKQLQEELIKEKDS